jgi:hypothetical protein
MDNVQNHDSFKHSVDKAENILTDNGMFAEGMMSEERATVLSLGRPSN